MEKFNLKNKVMTIFIHTILIANLQKTKRLALLTEMRKPEMSIRTSEAAQSSSDSPNDTTESSRHGYVNILFFYESEATLTGISLIFSILFFFIAKLATHDQLQEQ